MRIKMTKELARAAAWDAGNASAKSHGGPSWTKEDWYVASRTYNRLWPTLIDERPTKEASK